MGTQKSIAEKIIAASSNYILSLKDNHPTLHQQVKNWFEKAKELGFKGIDVSINQRLEKGHCHHLTHIPHFPLLEGRKRDLRNSTTVISCLTISSLF
ncbi:hypothetical protein [Nostoc sp.]|uniref:hypothetical protein n=1 Tax=Nostoc sp. TaxID=1180 RepID=UPI002FF2204F